MGNQCLSEICAWMISFLMRQTEIFLPLQYLLETGKIRDFEFFVSAPYKI